MSTTAFGLGAKYFALYELSGYGIQWNNIALTPIEGDTFSLYQVRSECRSARSNRGCCCSEYKQTRCGRTAASCNHVTAVHCLCLC